MPKISLRGMIAAVPVALLLLFGLTILLSPSVCSRGMPQNDIACMNNIRQIALAILNYEAEHLHLPPTCTFDEDGNPLHSWRTLILPYLGHRGLFEQIDLTKPWNHPDNASAASVIPFEFRCPRR